MKILIRVLLLQISGLISLAASIETEDDCRRLADRAMVLVGKGEYDEAFSSVKADWPLPPEEMNRLAKLTKEQLAKVSERFGDVVGTEFIRQDSIGRSYIRFTYIQKFERHATCWHFIFYKPKNVWLLNGLTWDDSTQLLFELPVSEGAGKRESEQVVPPKSDRAGG